MGRCATCGGEHADGSEDCPGAQDAVDATLPREQDAPLASVIPRGTMLEGVYRVGDCIGQGGMGSVYVVEHVGLGKRFAAKVLGGLTAADPEAVLRLQNEARAASAIEHDNIVNVTHLGRTDKGSVFIVMELLEGESLRARLLRQSVEGGDKWLPDDKARSFGEQILAGLGAAHRAGIVHRDLKPENVLLARKADRVVVKLVDFGISKLVTPTDVRLTRTGQVFGTPLYMSPEQGRSAADVDHRTDLYAAGVILYELVTGSVPFEGDSVSECLIRHATEPPPAPSVRRPALPGAVEAVILKCLAKKPQDRYPSAEAALEAWRTAWRAPASTSAASGTLSPTSRPAEAPSTRTSRATLALGALVVVGLASWLGSMAVGPASTTKARESQRGSPAASPLLAEDAVLACPLLAASGVEEPSGWLGAAAASIVCERARVILGGRYERTLVPAELLDLPRAPVDDFPADPYGKPDARARSTAAAKARAAAWVEGEVTSKNPGFRVALRLRAKDGHELARSEGDGRALYEAVRAAMGPLLTTGALPKAERLDPEIAEWSRAASVDAALALLDAELSNRAISAAHADECARSRVFESGFRELRAAVRADCAFHSAEAASTERETRIDLRSGPTVAATSVASLISSASSDFREAVNSLERFRASERSRLGQAVMAAVESCLLQASEPRRAQDLALIAVSAQPKTFEGSACRPWGQLQTVTQLAIGAVRGYRAWQPYEAAAWAYSPAGSPDELVMLRRARVLAPLDPDVTTTLVGSLLASGRHEEAQSVASSLGVGSVSRQLASQALLARVDASRARFATALERCAASVQPSPTDAGWLKLQRLEIGWQAMRIAEITGEQTAWAERMSSLFLAPEPPPADLSRVPAAHAWAAAMCLLGPRQRVLSCYRRLDQLEKAGYFQNDPPDIGAFVKGARRYAVRDYPGAARAWRPFVRGQGLLSGILSGEMVDAFERVGQDDLAERVDAPRLATGGEYNGADSAHLRSARRAARRGDRDRALAFARKVIDAWSVADVPVPAVEEMRRLVARLER